MYVDLAASLRPLGVTAGFKSDETTNGRAMYFLQS